MNTRYDMGLPLREVNDSRRHAGERSPEQNDGHSWKVIYVEDEHVPPPHRLPEVIARLTLAFSIISKN